MYEYYGIVVSAYDGDTLRVDIDLGFSMMMKNQSIRLHGLNAPELRGETKPQAIASRDFVSKLIGKKVVLRTHKDKAEKYGRWLADVFYVDDRSVTASDITSGLKHLNAELIKVGLAVPFMDYE
jgi:micrococcal nuclease